LSDLIKRKREREGERKREKKKRKRERESTSTAERGETYIGTKKEVNKSCRSVPSQWHHSSDATSNRERENRERERSI